MQFYGPYNGLNADGNVDKTLTLVLTLILINPNSNPNPILLVV